MRLDDLIQPENLSMTGAMIPCSILLMIQSCARRRRVGSLTISHSVYPRTEIAFFMHVIRG